MATRLRRKIERKMPAVGTTLYGKFKDKLYFAKVSADASSASGRVVEYAGRHYVSMTSAAEAITHQPTNGWRFWKLKPRA